MEDYTDDYIKEKAKINYELIKVLTVLFIAISAGTIGILIDVDFKDGVPNISLIKFMLMSVGAVLIAILGLAISELFVDTNALLRILNKKK